MAELRGGTAANAATGRVDGRHLDLVRSQLEALFGAELDRLGPARDATLHALTAATTWSAWSVHRDILDLGPDTAREAMARTVTALLAPAG